MIRTLASISLCALVAACSPTPEADFVITGGTVFVGDNSPGFKGWVAVTGDEITGVGTDTPRVNAETIIDATGLIVSPGFIDPHTHSDADLMSDDIALRRNDNYRFQGVTTVFNGNDGFGPSDTAGIAKAMTKRGIGTHTALFVGHGAVRFEVMGGDKRAPTEVELREMQDRIAGAMKAGALGLSTGLFYAPGSFSDTDEVIALAKTAAEYGGIYDSHIRDESTYNIGLEAAVEEVLEIGREADIPVHIAHIKALGVDVWGKSTPIIAKVRAARAAGQKVTADQYPWPASGTRISNALIPRWVKAGAEEDYMARLNDPAQRDRIMTETAENLRRRGGPDAVLITQDKEDWQGKTLTEIAAAAGKTPVETALDIALAGDAKIASFNMSDEDITAFMTEPWVMTSSDGTSGHPRKFASFPRKYETYVRDRNIIDLPTFIYRSAGLTAETFGLCDRGFLRPGYKADIIAFDPNGFSQKADFHTPAILSEGVRDMWINGQAVITDGKSQNKLPGQVIKPCHRHGGETE